MPDAVETLSSNQLGGVRQTGKNLETAGTPGAAASSAWELTLRTHTQEARPQSRAAGCILLSFPAKVPPRLHCPWSQLLRGLTWPWQGPEGGSVGRRGPRSVRDLRQDAVHEPQGSRVREEAATVSTAEVGEEAQTQHGGHTADMTGVPKGGATVCPGMVQQGRCSEYD